MIRRLAGILSVVLLAGHPSAAQGDLVDQLFERSRRFEQSLKTLRARFTETTVSSLLTTPLVAEGELTVVRPMQVVFKYSTPEARTVLIVGNRLTVVSAGRPVERIDIGGIQKRIDRYFTGRSAKDLRGNFTITATDTDPALSGAYAIDMVPRRKQIREGLWRLQIWIDQNTFVTRRMRMTFPGGDTKTLDFEDVQINPPVDPGLFQVPQAAGR